MFLKWLVGSIPHVFMFVAGSIISSGRRGGKVFLRVSKKLDTFVVRAHKTQVIGQKTLIH